MSRPQRLTYLVKAAELTQRVATAPILERYGLSYAQLSMMLTVAHDARASGAALARMYGITAQSAGTAIAVLVRRGLIERHPDPARRTVLVARLTAQGRTVVEEAQAMLDTIDDRLNCGIADEDLAAARRVLATIVGNGGTVLPGII